MASIPIPHVDISLGMSPTRDSTGRIVGDSKAARDIGKRKSIEAALRAGEPRHELVLGSMRVGLLDGNLATNALDGSPRIREMRGPEALGRISHDLLQTRLPGGVSAFVDGLHVFSWCEGEREQVMRDGRIVAVDSRMTLVRDSTCAFTSPKTEHRRRGFMSMNTTCGAESVNGP